MSKEGQVENTAKILCNNRLQRILEKGEETGPKAQVEGGSWLGGDSHRVVSVSSVKEVTAGNVAGYVGRGAEGLRRPEKLKKSGNEVIRKHNPTRWFETNCFNELPLQ